MPFRVNLMAGFLGIDLASSETKPGACLGLDRELHLTYSGFLYQDSDILEVASGSWGGCNLSAIS